MMYSSICKNINEGEKERIDELTLEPLTDRVTLLFDIAKM